ncbi:MAG: hypothetical protein ABI451_07840 [Dokdonella sp.]
MTGGVSIGMLILAAAGSQSAFAIVPGGLAAGHLYASGGSAASQMTVTITVDVDPGIFSYFWAQQFWLDTTIDHGGYFGIQGNGVTGGQAVGKMLIFSIWNASGAVADPGATAATFGNEGTGWSIHRSYAWQAGAPYTFTLQKINTAGWYVYATGPAGEHIGLGRIDIAEDTHIRTGFANFTEYYGDLSSCSALPYAQATFSNLSYDGTLVAFNDAIAYGSCAVYASSTLPHTHANTHRVNAPDRVFRSGFN